MHKILNVNCTNRQIILNVVILKFSLSSIWLLPLTYFTEHKEACSSRSIKIYKRSQTTCIQLGEVQISCSVSRIIGITPVEFYFLISMLRRICIMSSFCLFLYFNIRWRFKIWGKNVRIGFILLNICFITVTLTNIIKIHIQPSLISLISDLEYTMLFSFFTIKLNTVSSWMP